MSASNPCSTCDYYEIKNPNIGYCKRYAPKPEGVGDPATMPTGTEVEIYTEWPRVKPTDWCGEWKAAT